MLRTFHYAHIICFLALLFCIRTSYAREALLKINGKDYTVELAVTEKERERGLMFRSSISPADGMFFMFEYPEVRGFYMKNTIIPLDLAFIGPDSRINEILEMEPLNEKTVISREKILYALEVNRGFFKRAGIRTGDRVEITEGSNGGSNEEMSFLRRRDPR